MAVSAAFHRNVFLLTQVIQPSEDFKNHFREGMFDKPNTSGFIHVSHYLLTIYDSDRFHKLVEWPIICKKTEVKYRNNVKDFLNIISSEHTDIGFPPILTSYLFHAGGAKFTTIMWKLSLVVLRTYIARRGTHDILSAPQIGPTDNLVKEHLKNCKYDSSTNILHHHKNMMQMEDAVKNVLMEENDTLNKTKTEFFEKKQSIISIASKVPVDASVKKRLTNVEDKEVIQMWKDSTEASFNYIKKKQAIWKDIENLSAEVTGMVMNKINNMLVLDAKQFVKLDNSLNSELPLVPEMQYLLHHLYVNDKLVLHNLISLFNLLLLQLQKSLMKNGLNELKDLSKYLVQIKASSEDVKSALNIFQSLLADVTDTLVDTQNKLCQRDVREICDEDALSMMNNILFMPSPLIKINTNCRDEKGDLQKRLELTPVEGLHKSLFSRYERYNRNKTPCALELRTDLLVSRINFDDVTIASNNDKSPRSLTFKTNWLASKKSRKYCHLFSPCMKKNNERANYSIMSIPYSSNANSTAMTNTTEEMRDVSELSLDVATRSLFNVSNTEAITSNKITPVKQDKCQHILQTNEDVIIPIKINKPDIDVMTEVQVGANDNSNVTLKTAEVRKERRSISDLVERYSKLLENSSRITMSLEAKYMEQEDQ